MRCNRRNVSTRYRVFFRLIDDDGGGDGGDDDGDDNNNSPLFLF
jgi:hypothetical protein